MLGLYRGIPATARGDLYGVGATLPDTITLYQNPIENEADALMSIARRGASIANLQQEIMRAKQGISRTNFIRKVIRETIWHEVAHHFGFDEEQVQRREDERDSM